MSKSQVIVIGAGAGGMMAAGKASESGCSVLLLEKTYSPGKKILISGKTRCNLTNSAGLDHFINMYGSNGSFLYNAFKTFFRDELLSFFRRFGVETSTENDGRIFPSSNNSGDIVTALQKYMADNRVVFRKKTPVSKILVSNSIIKGVQCGLETFPAEAVILATGGTSYPETGSTGDGYKLASALGHTIIPLRPALVPLTVHEKDLARKMQGTSLRDVRLTAFQCTADEIDTGQVPSSDTGRGIEGKRPRHPVIESRRGDMLITHFGLSGPAVLKMSLAVVDALKKGVVSVSIDLLPDLKIVELQNGLLENLKRHGKKTFVNFIKDLLPPKMIVPFTEIAGIPPGKQCNQITAAEREITAKLLKSLRFNIKSPLSMESAMVTAGGVSLKEIDPRTMSSKLVKGLYFCGEVMDIDAETGGYNLQAAFSTGFVSGKSAAEFVLNNY